MRIGPGLYRASLKIQKLDGPALGSYWQFIRVLPLRQKLSIGIRGGDTFQRGETVASRMENWGTREALLPTGSKLTVERLNGDTWEKFEPAESPSKMFEDPEFLPRGRASRCSYFEIPPDSTPGAFRFSAVVETGSGKPRKVTRQFTVI
jgi:hypothetical protein